MKYIDDQSDFDKFIAITTYIVACELVLIYFFSISLIQEPTDNLDTRDGQEVDNLVGIARQCLQPILAVSDHPDLVRALSILPHFTKNEILRREIIVAGGVASVLVRFLKSSAVNPSKDTLSLVVDSICHLLETKEGTCGNLISIRTVHSSLCS